MQFVFSGTWQGLKRLFFRLPLGILSLLFVNGYGNVAGTDFMTSRSKVSPRNLPLLLPSAYPVSRLLSSYGLHRAVRQALRRMTPLAPCRERLRERSEM